MAETKNQLEDVINKIRDGTCNTCKEELTYLNRKKSIAGVKIHFFEGKDRTLHLEIR